MTNNPNLFNGAVAGITGGNLERWISEGNFTSLGSAVNGLATAIDALIPVLSGGGSEQQIDLLQSITQGVLAGRSLIGLTPGNYTNITLAIVDSYNELSAILIPTGPSVWGTQATWAIDATNGSDSALGTPAAPLRTMAEFNRRMGGLFVTVAQTLQLVGDVIDTSLWLRGTTYASGASLTVLGTVTTIATTATITVVASTNTAGAGTLPPWQLTTTGIDWTTVPVGSRLSLSNGTIAFIRNVIDANNVVIGAAGTITVTSTAPTNGLTITVQALSRALPPNINVTMITQVVGMVTIRDLSFDTGNIVSSAQFRLAVLFFACEIKCATGTTIAAAGGLTIRTSRITMGAGASNVNCNASGNNLNFFSCVWSGATGGNFAANQPGPYIFTHAVMTGCQFAITNGANVTLTNSCNILHTATALLVASNGYVFASSAVVSGSAGAATGITVQQGSFIWSGAGNKPTLTGGADCFVGGTVYTYAALGVGKTTALLDAIPPTVQPVINTGTIGPGVATMSQT